MSAAPAPQRRELEVDHFELVAVEEHVVGPDVTVQEHRAFGQRGQRLAPHARRTARRKRRRRPEPTPMTCRDRSASPARTRAPAGRGRSGCRCSGTPPAQRHSPDSIDQACSPASCSMHDRARSIDRPARWSALSQCCRSSSTRTKSAESVDHPRGVDTCGVSIGARPATSLVERQLPPVAAEQLHRAAGLGLGGQLGDQRRRHAVARQVEPVQQRREAAVLGDPLGHGRR